MSLTEIIPRAALQRPLLVVPPVAKTWLDVTLSLLAEATTVWHTPLLIAPFDASCVLAFTLPQGLQNGPTAPVGDCRVGAHYRIS